MRLKLRLSPSLHWTIEGQLEVELQGQTIRNCLDYGLQHYSVLSDLVMKDGNLNPNMIFFHNDSVVKSNQLSKTINDGDILDVIPAIEAG